MAENRDEPVGIMAASPLEEKRCYCSNSFSCLEEIYLGDQMQICRKLSSEIGSPEFIL